MIIKASEARDETAEVCLAWLLQMESSASDFQEVSVYVSAPSCWVVTSDSWSVTQPAVLLLFLRCLSLLQGSLVFGVQKRSSRDCPQATVCDNGAL